MKFLRAKFRMMLRQLDGVNQALCGSWEKRVGTTSSDWGFAVLFRGK